MNNPETSADSTVKKLSNEEKQNLLFRVFQATTREMRRGKPDRRITKNTVLQIPERRCSKADRRESDRRNKRRNKAVQRQFLQGILPSLKDYFRFPKEKKWVIHLHYLDRDTHYFLKDCGFERVRINKSSPIIFVKVY